MNRLFSTSTLLVPVLLSLALFLVAFSAQARAVEPGEASANTTEAESADAARAPRDAIARVGDQYITFSYINTMLNSSAIVGLSVPTFGTPERDQVRLTLLDKMISGNLLYLDALNKGIDQAPEYQQDMQRFSDAVLASVYKNNYVAGDIQVTEAEVQDFFSNRIVAGTEMTEELKAGIEAKLRKQKFQAKMAALRDHLREGVKVVVHEQELDPDEDQVRDANDVVASIDGQNIAWQEVRVPLSTPRNAGSMENRLATLNRLIDMRLMTRKARQEGMEQDPAYLARVTEYKKTHLINIHRDALFRDWEPDDKALRAYFEKNRDQIRVKERRKVRMVVLKTEQEAREVKDKIESGEITIFQAAADYSITPDAKKTLGEIGWVPEGSGFPELDKVTFALGPDEIGGPVESPAGWHLVQVLDVQDAYYDDIEDEATRQVTRRRYIDEKLDAYVINLRKNEFNVEIYDDTFYGLAQQEVDWFKEVSEKTQKTPEQIIEDIQKLKK
jgi:parvulin-like peptidyl-prolyl isomerase